MFGKKKEVVVEAPKEYAPSAKTVIGEGITLVGSFDTKDPIEIKGRLEGDIKSSNVVHVACGGSMKGNGVMQAMEVEGTVDGEIECLEVAKIAATGIVSGSLATVRLQTEDGSTFDGKLSLIQSKAKEEVVEESAKE